MNDALRNTLSILGILLIALLALQSVNAMMPCSNMTGNNGVCYEFEQNTTDLSGNNNGWTNSGSNTFVTGTVSGTYALNISATTSYATPNTRVLNTLGSQAFVVSFWMKLPSSSSTGMIWAESATNTGDVGLNVSSTGKLIVLNNTNMVTTVMTSNDSVNDGRWHHIVLTRSAILSGTTNTTYLYIDGVLSASALTNNGFSNSGTGSTCIGSKCGSGGIAGLNIDRFMSRAGVYWDATNVSQAYNSGLLFINVIDEQTNSAINTAGAVVSNSSNTVTMNTTNGQLVIQNIAAGSRYTSVSSSGYGTRSYYISANGTTNTFANAYLLSSSVDELVTFTLKDDLTGNTLGNGTVVMQNQLGNGTWVTIGAVNVDDFGNAVFGLQPGHTYQLSIDSFSFGGYTYAAKTGTVTPTLTSYAILLNGQNTQSYNSYLGDFSYALLPSGQVSANSTLFRINTVSPDGTLSWFSVNVSLSNGSSYQTNVTGSPNGGSASQTINLSGFTGTVTATYRAKSTNFATPMSVTRSWYLYNATIPTSNYTFVDFVEYYGSESSPLSMTTRGILVTLVAVLLAAGAGLFINGAAAMMIAATVFLMAGVFGWLSLGITIVTVGALVGLLLLGGRS